MNLTELIIFLVNALRLSDPNLVAIGSPTYGNHILVQFSDGRAYRIIVEKETI